MRAGIEWGMSFVFLLLCTVVDIRKREIPLAAVLIFGGFSVAYRLIWGNAGWADNIFFLIYSCMPGIFFLALALCSRESIGYGDGLAVLVLGMLAGGMRCAAAAITGLLFSALCGLVLLACKKAGGKTKIPFLPFLTAGMGVVFIAQKGL